MLDKFYYHYTSISSLALILKNKSFRLNSLKNVDDITEVKFKDFDTIGKYCFISSWIDEKFESMPLWIQYGDNMEGVRIGLRKDPFKQRKVSPDVKKFIDYSIGYSVFKEYEDLNILNAANYFPIVLPNNFFTKIEYTNDWEKINSEIYSRQGDFTTFALGNVGKYKLESWNFQNEVRYKIFVMPYSAKELGQGASYGYSLEKAFREDKDLKNYFYDLELSDDAFNNMQITIGPKMSIGSRQIVDDLIEKYNPNVTFKTSELEKTIRH